MARISTNDRARFQTSTSSIIPAKSAPAEPSGDVGGRRPKNKLCEVAGRKLPRFVAPTTFPLRYSRASPLNWSYVAATCCHSPTLITPGPLSTTLYGVTSPGAVSYRKFTKRLPGLKSGELALGPIQECAPEGAPVVPAYSRIGCGCDRSVGKIQVSNVRLRTFKFDEAGIRTASSTPSKLNACPTIPFVNETPFINAKLFVLTLSLAFPSAGHQLTSDGS